MKKRNNYLFAAITIWISSPFYLLAAINEDKNMVKVLLCCAALCSFVSGLGFLYEYIKNKGKKNDD